jgi:hypothetical protein
LVAGVNKDTSIGVPRDVGWTKAEFEAAPEAITRLRRYILDLEGEIERLRTVKDVAAILLRFVPEHGAMIHAGYGRSREELMRALADYYGAPTDA